MIKSPKNHVIFIFHIQISPPKLVNMCLGQEWTPKFTKDVKKMSGLNVTHSTKSQLVLGIANQPLTRQNKGCEFTRTNPTHVLGYLLYIIGRTSFYGSS